MSRFFWAALGAAAGVVLVRRVSRKASQYTPEGMARNLASVGEGMSELATAVREGMREREGELRIALGVDTGAEDGQPDPGAARASSMDPDLARHLIENPTAPRDYT